MRPAFRIGSRLLVGLLGAAAACSAPRDADPLTLDGAYPATASPTGVLKTFSITAAPTELPLIDGGPRRVWAYNGQVPGPTLRIRLGDTLRVHFTNELPQPTTIHWHGVRLPNAMDGVPHATQPPIEPGGSFTYEFTPKDAGTFWFHPHVRSSEQVERGLYGALIVEDREPPPYAQDVLWILDDWLLGRDGQIVETFNTPHDLSHDGRWGNTITVNGRLDTALHLAIDQRIRLRLLNASNGRIYVPDFGDVRAEVIAVDGLYLRAPIPLERFELAPGNRLDLDLTAPGTTSRLVTVLDRFGRQPNRLAELQVDGGTQPPTFPSPARARVPAWSTGLSAPITKEFKLDARRGGPLGIEWTFNDQAFAGHEHHHPAALALPRDRWARLRFTNVSGRLHPIHLHGMFFKVLGRNDRAVDEPFFRDTVLVHGRETVDIGLVPLDEGSWMMHCHILEHAEAGMMTMIDVGPPAR
ncbi:MAG: multicopper oxidase family protein [Myxococcota bacterium]|nr:multicopper oxidase family protein [Myxococcota bacterium]